MQSMPQLFLDHVMPELMLMGSNSRLGGGVPVPRLQLDHTQVMAIDKGVCTCTQMQDSRRLCIDGRPTGAALQFLEGRGHLIPGIWGAAVPQQAVSAGRMQCPHIAASQGGDESLVMTRLVGQGDPTHAGGTGVGIALGADAI